MSTYNVYRSVSSEGPYDALAVGVQETGYRDTAVVNGTSYYYFVTALNASGAALGNSNQISAVPAAVASSLLPPTNLNARSPARKQIRILWTAPSDATSATTYRIYRSTVTGGPYQYIDVTGSTTYLNMGMASGTTYYYVVTAVNGAGAESPYSNEASSVAR